MCDSDCLTMSSLCKREVSAFIILAHLHTSNAPSMSDFTLNTKYQPVCKFPENLTAALCVNEGNQQDQNICHVKENLEWYWRSQTGATNVSCY